MTGPVDQTETEVADALGAFLAKEASPSHNVGAADCSAGFDRGLLERLASMGLFAVASPADAGGLGLTTRLAGSCCAEAGRVLLGGPWLEQLLTARLLERAGATDLLGEVIAGSPLVCLPLAAPGWLRPPGATVRAGRARFAAATCELAFAAGVDAWLLPARDPASRALVLVRLAPDPSRCRPRRGFHPLWPTFEVQLGGADGQVVAELDERQVTAHLADVARLLACASVGATEAVLATATEYAKVRTQFGRPIGGFQALQHRLADVYVDLEHTRELVAASLEPDAGEARLPSAMAKVAVDRLAVGAAQTALQIHGGLGFTWELPVHHYLKTALLRRTLPWPTAVYQQWLRDQVLGYNL